MLRGSAQHAPRTADFDGRKNRTPAREGKIEERGTIDRKMRVMHDRIPPPRDLGNARRISPDLNLGIGKQIRVGRGFEEGVRATPDGEGCAAIFLQSIVICAREQTSICNVASAEKRAPRSDATDVNGIILLAERSPPGHGVLRG